MMKKGISKGLALMMLAVSFSSCSMGTLSNLVSVAAQTPTTKADGTQSTLLYDLLSGVKTNNTQRAQYATLGATLLSGMLSNMGKTAGQAHQFTGDFTGQLLVYNATNKAFNNSGKMVSSKATSTARVSASAICLTIPAVVAGNAQMSQVTITNLVANDKKIYGLSDNSTCTEGTLTYNGKTYNLANAYIELSYSETDMAYTASIYFDYNEAGAYYNYAMNVTFKSEAKA